MYSRMYSLLLLHSVASASTRASAVLKRTPGPCAGSSLLPLSVAESMTDCQRVIILTASLPVAERCRLEWRSWSSLEWEASVFSTTNELTPCNVQQRSVIFCPFTSAMQLAAYIESACLLVYDASAVHPRVMRSKRGSECIRLAMGIERTLTSSRTLYMSVEGSAQLPLLTDAEEPNMQTECVVSEAGSSCIGGEVDTEAHEPVQVCRWLTLGEVQPTARLAITSMDDGNVIVLHPDRAASILAQCKDVRLRSDADDQEWRRASYLTQLALAVLIVFTALEDGGPDSRPLNL